MLTAAKFSISNILPEQREKQAQRFYIHRTNKRLLSPLSIVCMYVFKALYWITSCELISKEDYFSF